MHQQLLLEVTRVCVVWRCTAHWVRQLGGMQPPLFGAAELEGEVLHKVEMPIGRVPRPRGKNLHLPPQLARGVLRARPEAQLCTHGAHPLYAEFGRRAKVEGGTAGMNCGCCLGRINLEATQRSDVPRRLAFARAHPRENPLGRRVREQRLEVEAEQLVYDRLHPRARVAAPRHGIGDDCERLAAPVPGEEVLHRARRQGGGEHALRFNHRRVSVPKLQLCGVGPKGLALTGHL
mmetsp:Transcript_44551/g.110418  ORF Transcript_44551/g.110418 Transcript_44551/m.110418 type:complete len:234 (-) Transcript_44551:41-742(-)